METIWVANGYFDQTTLISFQQKLGKLIFLTTEAIDDTVKAKDPISQICQFLILEYNRIYIILSCQC